jgi:hypothetical protein
MFVFARPHGRSKSREVSPQRRHSTYSIFIDSSSRKRKLLDKSIPNVILQNPEFAQDSQMYQDLLEMERKLDWTMMRKRVEVQDALGRIPSVRFFIVIYIPTFILYGNIYSMLLLSFPRRRAH